jgi:3-hydroxyacyl-CoA dehydrogenase
MEHNPVSYRVEDGVGLLHIDNPPVNALSQAVRAGIQDALAQAEHDDSRLLLVLCAGRTYVAGADIREFGKPQQEPNLPALLDRLENFTKPVATVLHGTALGGGLELAMACHYRAAVPGAKLGLPEVNLGLLPGAGGTQRLPRLVGVPLALDMMLSGKPIPAKQALQAGLLDATLDGDLESAALDWAKSLLADDAGPRPTRECEVATPEDGTVFETRRKEMAKRARGQIAPGHIIDLVELSTRAELPAGLAEERERFLVCRDSPQSAGMRHAFFAERAAAKIPGIGRDTPERSIERVAVIGAGTMGGGIAMCFAGAGIPVSLLETSEENLERGLARIRQNYAGAVKRGRLSEEGLERNMGLISGTTEDSALADADLVIEAVFEDMGIKQDVFRRMDALCKPGCILATNTSYLDINEIAAVTGRPQDVIGAHFFSPANIMKLLEIVRADQTAPEVVKTFMSVAKRIGKVAVAVGVCHGFVGNRMLQSYARQAQLLLLEGATPAQVDGAMEAWGMAMGPLAVADLAGLDIGYRARRNQGIKAGSDRVFALADLLVELERLGQKSGAGYYRYDSETRARQPDPKVEALLQDVSAQWGVERRDVTDEEITQRLSLALVNEGARILEEGIAVRASDIDVVYLNGYGFPRWRGGPMFHADRMGLPTVVARLETLREQTGDDRWEPAPLLRQLAGEERDFAALDREQAGA